MRPVIRGASPQDHEFDPYTKALPFLVSRLGNYCNYCERRVQVGLAVEHIQPKALDDYTHLIGSWTNYVLACTNCNSTKSKKDVAFSDLLIPDRDNTFVAFDYLEDGTIEVSNLAKTIGLEQVCQATLALTGLQKVPSPTLDDNGDLVALDRVTQRMDVWLIAKDALRRLNALQHLTDAEDLTIELALATGFFSIWMKVFENDKDMRNRLVDAFDGTRASGCFDSDGKPISPHPNTDLLKDGGKI